MTGADPRSIRALIYAPHGRDAAVATSLLQAAGVEAMVCETIVALARLIDDDTGLVVLTGEALRGADLRAIVGRLADQPPWSDLPLIVLTQRGGGPEQNPEAARLSELLGNVTFLERPFHPTTFVSVARTAQKGRLRQFEARSRMEELRENQARLHTALLAGHLGSWELNLETDVVTMSDTCKAVFGLAPDAPVERDTLMARVHDTDRPRIQAALRAALESGGGYEVEYRVAWPDGSQHWAEIRARLLDTDRGPRRLVGVAVDITDRKAAETSLKDINERLERRVTERTAELQQAHREVLAEIEQRERAEDLLRQAQKMEMIGELTGGVAHDFNNLLMAVLGNLELLSKHIPDDPRARRLIDGATQGAQRGAALTQRLLAFARRQDLKVAAEDLTALVRGMTDLLERSIGAQIELRFEAPDTPAVALVDANQVELALLNLVVNARDAMPDGGVLTLTVDTVSEPAGEVVAGRYVRLLVRDTGCGMDAKTLKKATEPFFSTKELGKGTGLGLSMIQGLAMQLHGALRLTSQLGEGTTAELLLPATGLAPQVEPDPPPAAPEGEDRLRARILVVDDDPLIAMSTTGMLEDLGHEVIEVNSGEEALSLLRAGEAIDLMVTDYAMPKMTGIELVRIAREITPAMSVLLATGYADLPEGAEPDLARIAKPYGQAQLAVEIARLLQGRSSTIT